MERNYLFHFVSVCIFGFSMPNVFEIELTQFTNFGECSRYDRRIRSPSMFEVETQSDVACMHYCNSMHDCLSVSYLSEIGTCQGSRLSPFDNSTTIADESGWNIYSKVSACEFLHGGHCYTFVSSSMTRDKSQEYCNAIGGHLPVVDNAEENEFIADMVKKAQWNGYVWIGATDRLTEGSFMWDEESEPVSFSNFELGQPNGATGEPCVLTQQSGGWRDVGCLYTLPSICERNL